MDHRNEVIDNSLNFTQKQISRQLLKSTNWECVANETRSILSPEKSLPKKVEQKAKRPSLVRHAEVKFTRVHRPQNEGTNKEERRKKEAKKTILEIKKELKI